MTLFQIRRIRVILAFCYTDSFFPSVTLGPILRSHDSTIMCVPLSLEECGRRACVDVVYTCGIPCTFESLRSLAHALVGVSLPPVTKLQGNRKRMVIPIEHS